MKKFAISLLTLALAATTTVANGQALTEGERDLMVVEQLAPEILTDRSVAETISVQQMSRGAAVDLGGIGDAKGSSIGFTVENATMVSDLNNSFSSVHIDGTDTSSLIQETNTGVRVLNVIHSAYSKSVEYSYKFDAPSDSYLTPAQDGYLITDTAGNVYGKLLTPWAVDATGQALATNYEWKDSVLTQKIDLSPKNVAFPVVADPNWTYTLWYALTTTASKAKTQLKACFNCEFPVNGAPKSFPVAGQLLPLTVPVPFLPLSLNMECKFRSETTSTNYFAFTFDATKNHYDGYGSHITFEIMVVSSSYRLVVSAFIVNDPLPDRATYTNEASKKWAEFAGKLNS